ncbi:hypothetical protein KC332_g2048 [Hortaea werneckii]|nr:hypothetical protein KC350_g5856 [Hortaea werneckii]KAI6848014.1 hypothetical protein KC358_g2028 [Hortaea werneckii]KAI6942684.1 hypothetical protein KC341_g2070 [Hortaea werneckii]KAI6948479.1 hypothetical protein KC348_g1905 [Hortaea werneckii]KAI6980520.1 hypothetical protein KC321_g1746 [Hortaea werneckii]
MATQPHLQNNPERADELGDQLRAHYLLRDTKRQDLTDAIVELTQTSPVLSHRLTTHLANAALASKSPVRTYDILGWMAPALPPDVVVALNAWQEYLHQEVFLRSRLARYEWRNTATDLTEIPGSGRVDEWTSDDQFAADASRRSRFGLETRESAEGLQTFEQIYEGREMGMQVEFLRAGLQIRQVRLEFARRSERYGGSRAKEWEAGRNVDRKVVEWVERALGWMNEKEREGVLRLGEGSVGALRDMLEDQREVLLMRKEEVDGKGGEESTDDKEMAQDEEIGHEQEQGGQGGVALEGADSESSS